MVEQAPEELRAEVERLRADNQRLRAEVERLRAELSRLGRYLGEPPPASTRRDGDDAIDWVYQRDDLYDDLGDD